MPESTAAPSQREQFLDGYRREHATTRKVLDAFPAAESEFRPHDRSSSARQLAWTFVVEEQMMLKAARGQPVLTGEGFPKAPESWAEIGRMFDRGHEELVQALEQAGDELSTATVTFPSGPNAMADYPAFEFLWFMLCDQIHHRGQLSVYVRMAGGRVPSIYGPSADEPWF